MEDNRFLELARKENGFEFCQAFREETDWVMGARGNTCWFVILKDRSVTETRIGTLADGVWTDRLVKGKGRRKTEKVLPAGSTLLQITQRAYFMQDEPWVRDRKPRLVADAHPHYHYVYGFGDRALDVSQAYGVSIGYSDLKDPAAGFHLRFLYTGSDVELPE